MGSNSAIKTIKLLPRPEFEAVELVEGDLAKQLDRNRAHVLVPPASLPEQLRRHAERRHAR